ncbi:hypothetical protein J6590_040124 [Homalodisca vitripennis]|nr:hypothetical protein J6590_088698 [Homalodisca vitripennis]KAG8311579.1 hypothetical protein J6590_040124 [Homalodisca vitripennis]
MTMMMMQRLLQENTNDASNGSSVQNVSGRPFNFANGGNILHHHPSSAFLRPPSSRSEDTKDSGKEGTGEETDVVESDKVRDDVSDSSKKEIEDSERLCRTPDDSKSRLSEESMDVEDRNDRLSSDEDFLNVDDDLGSPVDLTSRHRFLNRLHHHTMLSGDKAYRRQLDNSSPSSVSEANDDPPRRLAFSVENILDPTKFTGKEKDIALIRPRFQSQWRPLDVLDSSPDLLNHSGNTFLANYSIML